MKWLAQGHKSDKQQGLGEELEFYFGTLDGYDCDLSSKNSKHFQKYPLTFKKL